MRIVVALGGNALLERKDRPDAEVERRHIREAAAVLAPLARENQLIVCHGNGPQIGLLAMESDADPSLTESYPLDALGAQTQGMVGYWLTQELRNAGLLGPAVAVITQTLVDEADPGFASPTKFIGRTYTRSEAEDLAVRHGWQIRGDGLAWRRVVASPRPLGIVEQESIEHLLGMGAVVVCGGGGGAPVVREVSGRLRGVEAVVDKDYTCTRLALDLAADRLLLLTDVTAVMRDFGTPAAHAIDSIGVDELAELDFPAGSMGPKVDAAAWFTAVTGHRSAIGALAEAADVLDGRAGTTITGHGPSSPDSADASDAVTAPPGLSVSERTDV
ncbi:carbamate kinase [Rhodococcus sp. AQ5-07]|uniref:carbamate kinase n=1 Tax=Rhodococcus sp. AQ5-07 TaxID=2054902 RepID=UPI000DBFF50C|nr:carbamate kinase [Rhodococcus sp. AQ5-07]RAL30833.1 carbamate kinase [Rhodococcus sp. AQ5-07]